MFYLVDNHDVYMTLKDELCNAFPDHSLLPTLAGTEQLPYLISLSIPVPCLNNCQRAFLHSRDPRRASPWTWYQLPPPTCFAH